MLTGDTMTDALQSGTYLPLALAGTALVVRHVRRVPRDERTHELATRAGVAIGAVAAASLALTIVLTRLAGARPSDGALADPDTLAYTVMTLVIAAAPLLGGKRLLTRPVSRTEQWNRDNGRPTPPRPVAAWVAGAAALFATSVLLQLLVGATFYLRLALRPGGTPVTNESAAPAFTLAAYVLLVLYPLSLIATGVVVRRQWVRRRTTTR